MSWVLICKWSFWCSWEPSSEGYERVLGGLLVSRPQGTSCNSEHFIRFLKFKLRFRFSEVTRFVSSLLLLLRLPILRRPPKQLIGETHMEGVCKYPCWPLLPLPFFFIFLSGSGVLCSGHHHIMLLFVIALLFAIPPGYYFVWRIYEGSTMIFLIFFMARSFYFISHRESECQGNLSFLFSMSCMRTVYIIAEVKR